MAGAIDSLVLERKIGREAAAKLKTAFRNSINRNLNSRGQSKTATSTYKIKNERLDRITFVAPKHVFIQNFGFEGTKKNGIRMRLEAKNILNKALLESGVLETIADDISGIRGDQVIAAINFLNNGR